MMRLDQGNGKLAFGIIKKLQTQGFTSYFAGGCVRDYLRGVEPHDFDIATTAHPDQVEALFESTVPVGKQFGVMLVVLDKISFEVATFRCEGGYVDGRHPTQVEFSIPEDDARRRDFTVNGLFYDPFQNKVIDFVGGQEDLKRKEIRAIGDPGKRFDEDKLRLLRAIRFASTLGFQIEEKTWAALKERAALIHQVSPERIRDELVKIFTRPGAGMGFRLLSDSGLMREILPEIEAMKGIQQPPEYHPEGDVFIHTGLLMDQLNHPSLTIAFGALFHDVGKPSTFQVRNGKITFYNHAHVGALMTQQIMKRLRFSNHEIRDVSECVEQHMKFGDVQKMRIGKLKQFMTRETFQEEMEVHKIDCRASHGKLDNYDFLKLKTQEFAKEELKPKALITGHDLLQLGLPQSSIMKDILEELYELQLEGQIKNRDEALLRAEQLVRDHKKSL